MSDKDDIANQLANHKRLLQNLKETQALHGLDTPAQISIEIENIEAEIQRLQSTVTPIKHTKPSIIRREVSDVVIVHDDLSLAEVIAQVIKDEGLKASITYNFQTAMSLSERYQPRAIIADVWCIKKGELTIELANRIRELSPGTKILGLTASSNMKGTEQIFDRIFSKPVILNDIIDELLAQ